MVDNSKAKVTPKQKTKNGVTTITVKPSQNRSSAPLTKGPASVGAAFDEVMRTQSPVPQVRSPRFNHSLLGRSRGFVGIPVDNNFDEKAAPSVSSPFSNGAFRSQGSKFVSPIIGAGASSNLTPIERAAGKNALSFNKGPVKSSGYDEETNAYIQKGIEKAAKDGYFGAELLGKGSVTSGTMRIDTHRFRDLNGREHETHKERNSTDIRHLLTNYLPQNKREYFYYLLGKEGKPAAEKYLDEIKINDMEKPVMASVSEGRAKKFAEDHPFIERAARIALGPAGAFEGAYNLLGSALGRSDSSTTGKFEPSDSVSSAKRGFTAAENEWIDKNTGGASWFFKAGNAGTNMILDTLWLTPLGAAGKAAEGTKYAGKIIKGIHDTALFSQMFNDELGGQVAAGTSDKPGAFLSASVKSGLQALSFSTISNFNSKLFGKLGKTSAGLKRFAIDVAEATTKGAGINASQTFLGQVADLAIRGPFSDFSSAKQAYLDSGLSEKDATFRAVCDTLLTPTLDSAVTGGLIAAFYALPESASRMMAFTDHGRRVRSKGYDYIGDGLSLEESSAAHQFAQKLVKYADEGKPITDNMIGVSAWLNEVEHANRNEYISTIEGLTGTKVKVGFTSDPDKFNADLTPDNDIIVQPDTEHGFENSVRHETSHLIERFAPEEYTVFRDLLQGVEGRDAAIARIQDNYFRQTGKQQSVKAAEAELAADYSMRLGNKPDVERISRLVNERPAAADRAHNAIRWLEGHLLGGKTFVDDATGLRLTNKEAYELSRAYEKAFIKAAENVRDGLSGEGETTHSIRRNSKGKYVQADRQVLSGDDPTVWEGQLYDYINDHIRHGQDISIPTDDGDVLTISETTAWKMGYRNNVTKNGIHRPYTDAEYKTKINAASHIDEIGQVSTRGPKNSPDTKNHGFAQDGFNYRTAYFRDFDNSYYRLTISVGENSDRKTVYNIGKIKRVPFPDRGSKASSNATARGERNSHTPIISHDDPVVNNEIHSTRTARVYGLNARDEVRAFTSDKAVDKEFRQYLRITVADLVQNGFHALDSGDAAEGRRLLHEGGEIIEQHIRGQNSAGIADDFTETMINTFNGKKQNAIMEGRDIEGINDINNYGISVNSLMLGLDLQRGISPDTDTDAAKAHIRNAFTMANDNADRADIHNELRQAADIIVSGENRSYDDPASRNTAVNELASDLYNAYRDSQRAGTETAPDIIAADNAKYGRNIEGSFRDLLDAGNLKEGEVRGLSELTRRSIDTLYSGESDISNIRQDINKTIADLLYGHGHSDLEKQQITSTVVNNVLETANSLMSKEQARLNDLINSEITSGRAESELARQARADLADLKERIGALVQFDNSVNGVWKLSKAFTNTLMNPFNTSNQVEMFERMSEFTYQNEDNRTQYEKAKRELTERGIDRSITELMNKSKWEGSDNIKAFILSTYLGKLGMHREAVDLLVIYSQRNREAGRLVQSNMVAKLMTPEGRVMKFERDYTEALRAQYEYMHGKEAADLFSRNLDKARSIDNERRAAADDMLTRNFSEHRQAKENIENKRSEFLENSNDLADTISQLNENKSRSDILRERVGKHFGKIRGFLFSVKQSGEDNRNIYPIFEEFARLYNRVAQIETDMNRDINAELSDAPNDQQRENIINNLRKSYSLDEGFDYTRLYEHLDGMRRDMLQSFLDSHDVGYISPDELMNYGRWNVLEQNLREYSSDRRYKVWFPVLDLNSEPPTSKAEVEGKFRWRYFSDSEAERIFKLRESSSDRANTRDQLIKALQAEGFSGDEIRDMWNEHGSMDSEWVNYEILRSRLHKRGYTDNDISEIEAQNDGRLTPEIVDPLLYPDTPRFDPDTDQTSMLPDLDETEVSAALEELDSIYKRAAELDEERVKLEDRSGELAAMLNTANVDMARVIEAAMLRIQEGAKADDIDYNELAHADLFGLNYAVDSYLKRMKIGYIPEAERAKMKEWIFKIAACNSPDELIENILDLSEYRNTATFNKRGIENKLRRIYLDFEPLYDDNPSRGDKVDILKDIAFQQIVGSMADRTQSTRAKKARSLHFAVQLLGVPTFMRNIGSEVLMGIPETAVNNLAAVLDSGYALCKTALQMLNGKRKVGDINTDTFGEAFRKNRNFGFESIITGLPSNLKAGAKRSRESFIETALNVNLIGRDRTRFGKDIAYKRAFTKGPGAVMERALGYSLSVTDEAIKGYYIEQVRNSLKNTGLSDAEIDAEARAAADYRVFQNDSLVGITLEMLRKAANNIGFGPRNEDGVKEFGLGDFITTYTFVPGAVATRAFEYSPLGYSKALYMAYKMFHNAYGSAKADGSLKAASGEKVRFSENIRNTFSHISRTDARQTLLAFLRPVTGQGMIAAGALLRSKGIIIGTSQTNSYNQSLYEKSKNLGDFRINLSQLRRLINGEADDDTSHDDDLIADMGWLVPANTTLSIGADMYDRVGAAGFKIFSPGYLGDLITSSSNLASESLEDLAMWSSVNSIFQNRKNTNSVPKFLAAEGADMIFSFMPSLIRQIGGALDPYERDPYKASSVSELFFNKVRANIPFVREGVPLAIDSFGQVRERSIGNRVADFFSSGVSPSRLYRYRENDLTDELDRIAKQDPSVLPTSPYRDQAFELNGQEYKFKLADEEYQQFAQMQGKLWYKAIHSFYEDPDYNRLSDSMKISVLNDIKNDVVYHAAREIWVGYQTGKGEGDLTKIENDVIKKYRDAATNKIKNIQATDYLNQEGVNTEDVIDAGYYEPYTEAEKKEQIGQWSRSISDYNSYITKIKNGTFYDKNIRAYSRNWTAANRAAKIKEYQDKIDSYQRSIEDVSSGAKQKWHKVTGAFSQLSDKEKAAVVTKMEREPGSIHLPDDVRNNKPDFSNAGPSVIDVSKPLVNWRESSTVVGDFLDPTKWDTRGYDSMIRNERERNAEAPSVDSADSSPGGGAQGVDEPSGSKNAYGSFSRSYKGFYRYKRKRRSYRRRSFKRRDGSRGGGKSRSRLPYINSNALGSGNYNNRSGGLSRFGNRFGRGGSSRFTGSAAFGDSSSSRIPTIGGDQRKRGWKY